MVLGCLRHLLYFKYKTISVTFLQMLLLQGNFQTKFGLELMSPVLDIKRSLCSKINKQTAKLT